MLENKIALVTGASRGIGAVVALELAKQGAVVVGTATTEEGAQKITQQLQQTGVKGKGVVLNVNEPAAIEQVLADMESFCGHPEILVNNAGITRDNLILRMKDDEWNAVIETNLTSVFRLTRICLKSMIKARWGRIINISSIVGITGNAGQANYAAAKAGLCGLTKSVAQEVASRNITANIVAPGFIETDMTDKLTEAQKAGIMGAIPMRQIGKPHDIANAVIFLASPQSGYITGQTLHVNGGMYMN